MSDARPRGPENIDDIFQAIMEDNRIALDGGRPETLRFNGYEVPVSSYLGEELRHRLIKAFADEMLMPNMPFSGEIGLTEQAADRTNEILQARLVSPAAPVRLGGWLALRGDAVFAATEREGQGADVLPLSGKVAVFGRLAGAGYSPYPYHEDLDSLPLQTEGGYYGGEMTSGLVVLLQEAVICEAEETGEMGDRFEWLSAPLAFEQVRFYKVCQDLSSLVL